MVFVCLSVKFHPCLTSLHCVIIISKCKANVKLILTVYVCLLQLKDMFPGFRLSLPPKRWFKDNYDSDFLEDRQLGLQAFLQNLIAHKDIANWYVVSVDLSYLS